MPLPGAPPPMPSDASPSPHPGWASSTEPLPGADFNPLSTQPPPGPEKAQAPGQDADLFEERAAPSHLTPKEKVNWRKKERQRVADLRFEVEERKVREMKRADEETMLQARARDFFGHDEAATSDSLLSPKHEKITAVNVHLPGSAGSASGRGPAQPAQRGGK